MRTAYPTAATSPTGPVPTTIATTYRTSAIPTSNRPLEDWGKLIGDVPAATAILDRFLHNADVISIKGKSYRMKDRAARKAETPTPENQTCKETAE